MKVGNIVRWAGKSSEFKVGVVCSYCDFQGLWYVVFPDGSYEIVEHYLEVLIDHDEVKETHKSTETDPHGLEQHYSQLTKMTNIKRG
jgi:flagellar biosynthesis protein FlhB|tara:strand:+ start:4908 stop:5168 length:261 start_codon:yes stop_codon:yes gene_type:complete